MIVKFIVIGIYFAILLLLGALASRRIRDERDYIVGGKKLGFWLVSFSARATGESAWLILGLSGLAYKLGLVALWVVLGETLGVAICWLFMTKRFKRLTDRYDSSTVPDYLTDRVHSRSMAIRWVSAIALTVFVSIYVSAQLHATGQAFEGFLQVDYHIGVAVGFVVVLVYIVSGGFIAVVWSDLFQGALMLAALIGLPIFGLALLGGPSELFRVLAADDPGLLNAFGPAGFTTKSVVMIVGLVAVGVGYLGSPQVFVRFISIADTDEIDKGRWVAISYTIIAGLGAVFTGLCARAVFFTQNKATWVLLAANGFEKSQQSFTFLANTLPDLFAGMMIAVVLSAIMSTADSLLILAASSVVHDTYRKLTSRVIDEHALTRLSRYATLGLAFFALAITYAVASIYGTNTSIYWYVIFGWSGIAATFCPVIILSLVWRGLTPQGMVTGMVSGFFSVLALKALAQSHASSLAAITRFLNTLDDVLVISTLIAMLLAVVVSRLTTVDRPAVDADFAYVESQR